MKREKLNWITLANVNVLKCGRYESWWRFWKETNIKCSRGLWLFRRFRHSWNKVNLIIYECFDVESEGNSICTNEKRLYGIGWKKKKIVFEVETEIEELIWKLSNWKLYNLKMYDDKYKFWIVILEGRSNIYKKEKFWLRLYEIIFVDACANNLEINSLCSFHKYHYKFSILLYVIQRKIILIFRFNNWSPNLSVNYCILYLTHFF